MRARLFALLILVLIIGIPAGIYWYFFTRNTASITVSVVSGEDMHIQIAGTLDNENLPLADRLLQFEKDCGSVCVFSPVAPIRYTMTLTSPGKATIIEDIVVGIGEDKKLSYTLQDDLIITPLERVTMGNTAIANAMIANATKKDTTYTYLPIGIDEKNTVYVERMSPSIRELGILSLDKFTSLYRIPNGVGNFVLDITGQYFVAPLYTDKSLILSLDAKTRKEVSMMGVVGYVGGTEQKVLTSQGVSLIRGNSYGNNPRFTDWLDISSTQRLGYIDKSDTERLSLSGLPLGTSVLVLLNRTTGESHVVKRGVDIRFLFFLDEDIVFIDSTGKVSIILPPATR